MNGLLVPLGSIDSLGFVLMRINHYPPHCSVDECQRISFEGALAKQVAFCVTNASTSALGVRLQAQVIIRMKALQRDLGFIRLFFSHNLVMVRYVSDELGVMYLGTNIKKSTILGEPELLCWEKSPTP